MQYSKIALFIPIAGLLSFAAVADESSQKVDSQFYLAANVGYGTNLTDGLDDNKAVYSVTAGIPLNATWAVESDFHYWHSSGDVGIDFDVDEDIDVYAIDLAMKASYPFTPTVQGFVKAGYSYLHAKDEVNFVIDGVPLSFSLSDNEYKPVASIGLKADYGRYFTTLAYNHFFADDPYDISSVTIGFGYKF